METLKDVEKLARSSEYTYLTKKFIKTFEKSVE